MDQALKILLVEDDEVDRAMVRRALKASGLPSQFDEVTGASEAIAALKKGSYDCVLLDYRLPDADGLTVLRGVREAGITTPIIVMTGQGDEQLAVEIMKAGASDYLSKSRLSRDLLSHSVRHVVRLKAAQSEADLARGLSLESEDRFQRMADSAPVLLWMTDEKTNCTYLNQVWLRFTGRMLERSLGSGWVEAVHPEDVPRLMEKCEAAYASPARFEVDYRLRRADGEYRWVVSSASPRYLPDGRFAGFIGSCSDITDRKLADQERAASLAREREARAAAERNERHYRFLAEFIPQIVFTASAEGRTEYYNQRWSEYSGLQRESGQEDGWQLIVHPGDRAGSMKRWADAVASGGSFEIEYRLRRHDGVYRWHLGRAEALRDSRGNITRWFGTCTDIHDQKRSAESLSFLAEASEILGSSLDYETTLAAVARLAVPRVGDWCAIDIGSDNGQLRRLAVVHSDPLKLQVAAELRGRYSPAADAAHGVAHVLRTGESELHAQFTPEFLGSIAKDEDHARLLGTLGLKSAMIVPLKVRDRTLGVITFVNAESGHYYTPQDLALAEDLARRAATAVDNARLYGELRAAKESAEAANAAKDQFLAVLSHELRTPLTPVLSTVQAMESDPEMPPSLQPSVEMIRRNVELEARLIDDLLDLTRIANGKLELNVQPVDAHECVRNALDICYDEMRGKRQQLVLELNASHCFVDADSARLHQVFWNLIKNAIKFTPEAGRITIRSENDPAGRLLIEVSDTGIGIEPALLPLIFNAFEQGERSVTRRFGGLGLGLAISKALVDKSKGRLTVRSAGKNSGSSFVVELPSVPDPVATGSNSTATAPAAPVGLRILVVDDHVDTAKAMRRLLERSGYKITLAGSVREALAAFHEADFDLLISDIGLPDGSGLELMREIRQQRLLPGIALSGFGMEEDIRKSRDAGFAEHLIKPINFQKLDGVIRELSSKSISA